MFSRNSLVAFLFLSCFAKAQNEFDKYGPFGSQVYTDLKEALKLERGVYKLDLSYQTIDPKLYEKLPKIVDLQALKLSGNKVENYPEGFENLVNLLYFASYNNRLLAFPPALQQYRNLQYLDLQHTAIDSIPAQIAFLSKLQSFKFGNTDDSLKLPVTFKFLKSLKDLTIENCIMDSLPALLFKAPALSYIYLSNTNTWYLPRQIGQLQNLEVLVVENNQLRTLPFDIYKARKLRILSLRGNKISRLPDSISQLEELSILDLRGNPIEKAEIDVIRALLPGCEVRF